ILDQVASVIFYVIVVGSIYLLFAGHNQPGGGFVGGLVAGAAIALRYIAGGLTEVRRISPLRPWTILGGGLFLAALVAVVPVVLGGAVLESAYTTLDLPLVGELTLVSAAAFDLGVYLVVVGLVLMVFEAFGEAFDRPSGPEREREVTR
ncbi:MAG: MnhB domain-containing protein, partial [Microthrixaceae bacterium]